MLNELFAAAERGVRVRLLLDDNGITGLDNQLNRLDRHPNIEVRLFNPFVIRNPKWLGYITDFSRVNRRMHNKAFTVDNMVTISGGRNIGDEYFGASHAQLFTDLDVLCVGAVVDAVSRDFDAYWTSDSAYPASKILLPSEPAVLDELDREQLTVEQEERAAVYVKQVRESVFVQDFLRGKLPLQWTQVHEPCRRNLENFGARHRGQKTPLARGGFQHIGPEGSASTLGHFAGGQHWRTSPGFLH